jgi:hypothetical protein
MSDSIINIFAKALEKQGAKLDPKQVSIVLRDVEDCGVPIDWNGWYNDLGNGYAKALLASTPR